MSPEVGGAWPFIASQCPLCRYFYAYEQDRADDTGYDLPGFCRHPRIAMELFVSRKREDFSQADCSMFVRAAGTGGSGRAGASGAGPSL